MKKVMLLNLLWVGVGFVWWLFCDFLYVKDSTRKEFYDLGAYVLIIWPFFLAFPILKEIKKEKNKELNTAGKLAFIFICSAGAQYIGLLAIIATIGIRFHFSIGGSL